MNCAAVSVKTMNSVKTENSSKVSFVVESLDGHSHVIRQPSIYNDDQIKFRLRLSLTFGATYTLETFDGIEIRNVGKLEIELIISCETPEAHWSLDQRVGNRHQPFAVKTVLGWILFGPLGKDNANMQTRCVFCLLARKSSNSW